MSLVTSAAARKRFFEQAFSRFAFVLSARLAEGERFELSLGLPLSLISSQVPSTTQPPFHSFIINNLQSY